MDSQESMAQLQLRQRSLGAIQFAESITVFPDGRRERICEYASGLVSDEEMVIRYEMSGFANAVQDEINSMQKELQKIWMKIEGEGNNNPE